MLFNDYFLKHNFFHERIFSVPSGYLVIVIGFLDYKICFPSPYCSLFGRVCLLSIANRISLRFASSPIEVSRIWTKNYRLYLKKNHRRVCLVSCVFKSSSNIFFGDYVGSLPVLKA